MPDREDETRPPAPSRDAASAVPPPDQGAPRADPAAGSGDTVADPGRVPPVRGEPAAGRPRPDATSVMPAADDWAADDWAADGRAADEWAPGRVNPAWLGRAEVRAPRPPGAGHLEDDWAAGSMVREPRDRWWMPIVVGIIALLLLAALGVGIYLIVQNSGGDKPPAPVVSTPPVPATTAAPAPPPVPTLEPSVSPSTTDPATTEVEIPALVGQPLPDAQAALFRTGLRSYKLIYRENDAPPGTVLASDPVEGQVVPPDTTVTLVVAKPREGATPTAVPTTTVRPTEQPGSGGD